MSPRRIATIGRIVVSMTRIHCTLDINTQSSTDTPYNNIDFVYRAMDYAVERVGNEELLDATVQVNVAVADAVNKEDAD